MFRSTHLLRVNNMTPTIKNNKRLRRKTTNHINQHLCNEYYNLEPPIHRKIIHNNHLRQYYSVLKTDLYATSIIIWSLRYTRQVIKKSVVLNHVFRWSTHFKRLNNTTLIIQQPSHTIKGRIFLRNTSPVH